MATDSLDVAPWGMGWTRRIGGPEFTAGCSTSEAYARRLFVGLGAVGGPVTALAAATSLATGEPIAITGMLASLAAATVLAVVVPVATGGRFFRASVHGLLLAQQLVVFGQIAPLGGLPHGVGPLFWGAIAPPVAALLLGPRAAAAWLAVFTALVGLSVAAPDFPVARAEPTSTDVLTWQVATGAVVPTAALLVVLSWFVQLRQLVEEQLEVARSRAHRLLEDVLPAEIATRLEDGEQVIADQYYEVTVLFADVVGFTPMSAEMTPAESVALLNDVFSAFDAICARYGVEKIRTVGDGYMAVSGAPVRRDDHADAMARVALAMRDHVKGDLKLRIGMNSGPAVGGVIGTTRFHYDLWGDAVNVAARMESHGEPGRIQIGPRTHALLGRCFRREPRGTIDVKGRGPMETWWLEAEVR